MPLPLGTRHSDHGLLCVNHEYVWPNYLVQSYRPGGHDAEELARYARIGMASVGCSVVEVRQRQGLWRAVPASFYNRRLTAET